jgi:alpha-ribazole phosphatase
MRLDLVRHLPALVAPGTCYGRSEVACASPDASALAAFRATLGGAHVLSSPSRRCLELARALAPDVHTDARLLEIDFGAWEQRAFDALERAAIDAWAAAPWDFVPPGGESAACMAARVDAALDDVLALRASHTVVVAHGGPLRVILGRLLRAPREAWLGASFEPGDVVSLHLEPDPDRPARVFARRSLRSTGG